MTGGSKCAQTTFCLILIHEYLETLMILNKALHSKLLTKLSSRVSSRNEFSRVRQVRKKLEKLVPTQIFGKREFPKLTKTKTKNAIFLNFFAIFRDFQVGFRDGTSFRESRRVRKARTLPKYFRNSKNGNIRKARKRKVRKKPSNTGP